MINKPSRIIADNPTEKISFNIAKSYGVLFLLHRTYLYISIVPSYILFIFSLELVHHNLEKNVLSLEDLLELFLYHFLKLFSSHM